MPSVASPSLVTVPSSVLTFHRIDSHITVAYTVGGTNTVLDSDTVTGPDTVAGGTTITGADVVIGTDTVTQWTTSDVVTLSLIRQVPYAVTTAPVQCC